MEYPEFCWRSHRVSQPLVQYSHCPQAQPSHGMATRSPSATRVTPGPTRWTIPTPSWPGTNGGFGLTGQSPFAAWMSVWHRPEDPIFTSTWPAPGSGIGRSSMTTGCLNPLTTAAFMSDSLRSRFLATVAGHQSSAEGPTAMKPEDLWSAAATEGGYSPGAAGMERPWHGACPTRE